MSRKETVPNQVKKLLGKLLGKRHVGWCSSGKICFSSALFGFWRRCSTQPFPCHGLNYRSTHRRQTYWGSIAFGLSPICHSSNHSLALVRINPNKIVLIISNNLISAFISLLAARRQRDWQRRNAEVLKSSKPDVTLGCLTLQQGNYSSSIRSVKVRYNQQIMMAVMYLGHRLIIPIFAFFQLIKRVFVNESELKARSHNASWIFNFIREGYAQYLKTIQQNQRKMAANLVTL